MDAITYPVGGRSGRRQDFDIRLWCKADIGLNSPENNSSDGVWSNRSFVFWCVKSSKEVTRELRKRIVARAHDYDPIAASGQSDQQVATGCAFWKSKGLSAAPLDFTNNIVAADAAIDRTAEINGRRHDQNILVAQPASKAVHQGVSHKTNRAIAVGLKHNEQAARERVQGLERGRYLVGVVGKVVDHGYSI